MATAIPRISPRIVPRSNNGRLTMLFFADDNQNVRRRCASSAIDSPAFVRVRCTSLSNFEVRSVLGKAMWPRSTSTAADDGRGVGENSSDGATVRIPKSTWSINDLRLTSSSPSDARTEDRGERGVTDAELEILARRCLIDVSRLPPLNRESLRESLADIMRCVSVLVSDEDASAVELQQQEGTADEDGAMADQCGSLYDRPGRVIQPLREDPEDGSRKHATEGIVMNFIPENKLVKGEDGGLYFSAITNITKLKDS